MYMHTKSEIRYCLHSKLRDKTEQRNDGFRMILNQTIVVLF